MKKIIKSLLCFLLLISIVFSFCSCFASFNIGNSTERAAQNKIEEYLKENYGKYKILNKEQMVFGNLAEGVTETDIVKFDVKLQDEKYVFYYNTKKDIVCSNVNFDKITHELAEYIKQNNFISESAKIEIKIDMYDYEWYTYKYKPDYENFVIDSHKTVEDLFKYENKDFYQYEIFVYSDNEQNLSLNTLNIEEWYDNMKHLDFTLTNYSKDKLGNVWETEKLKTYYSDNENKIIINYNHKTPINLDDGTVILYDDNSYDIDIELVNNTNANPPQGITYKGNRNDFIGVGDKILINILDTKNPTSNVVDKSSRSKDIILEETDNKVIILPESNKVEFYFPKEKYIGLYSYESNDIVISELKATEEKYIKEYMYIDILNKTEFSIEFYESK